MAEINNARYIVKHVDGVMHLIANPQGKVVTEAASLRPVTTLGEKTEQAK